jgi:hypothetical protein
MSKKKWSMPKLTILERGHAEESCLLACKPVTGYTYYATQAGPAWGSGRCTIPRAPTYSCNSMCNVGGSS